MARLEDEIRKANERPAPQSRTPCCGIGAWGRIIGVYVIQNPRCERPTQTAERVGGFRSCSKCFKPLGDCSFKSGHELPLNIWNQMIYNVRTNGEFAYYAQRNPDNTIGLYDWTKHPFAKSYKWNAPGATIKKIAAGKSLMSAHEEAKTNGYQPEQPEFLPDAQEPGNAPGDIDPSAMESPPWEKGA